MMSGLGTNSSFGAALEAFWFSDSWLCERVCEQWAWGHKGLCRGARRVESVHFWSHPTGPGFAILYP